MTIQEARKISVQAWAYPATSHIPVSPELAEAFAQILYARDIEVGKLVDVVEIVKAQRNRAWEWIAEEIASEIRKG